jgi:heme/copper-type cytochrome/quinol oxidase subunit 4
MKNRQKQLKDLPVWQKTPLFVLVIILTSECLTADKLLNSRRHNLTFAFVLAIILYVLSFDCFMEGGFKYEEDLSTEKPAAKKRARFS